MSAPTSNDRQPLQLGDEQRDALVKELFAHWEVLNPGPGLDCFSGNDEDLVAQVQHARAQREALAQQQARQQQARQQPQRRQAQRGDDEPEL